MNACPDSDVPDSTGGPNLENLTEEERAAVQNVMARAKEVEQQEQRRLDRLRQPLEGQLFKWTNVVKGWQSRWFHLDPTASVLYYYMSEDKKRGSPRGSIMLDGAVIAPSDDDSQSFAISATNGENFRLKALDAKERQSWVMRLRRVVEQLKPLVNTNTPQGVYISGASSVSSLSTRQEEPHARKAHVTDKLISSPHPLVKTAASNTTGKRVSVSSFNTHGSFSRTSSYQGHSPLTKRKGVSSGMTGVEEVLQLAEAHHEALTSALNNLSSKLSEAMIDPYTDKDLLMLKAVAHSTLSALSHCHRLMVMQSQHRAQQMSTAGALPPGASIEWLQTNSAPHSDPPSPALSATNSPHGSAETSPLLSARHFNAEVSNSINNNVDDHLYEDIVEDELEIETNKQRKSVVLHLLSQLKLGMDLSRVVLPTFILEKRSLLEMYGDFLSHPEMFASIADGQTSEDRMIRVVKYFVTSVCAARKGCTARKPYNPILGEFFECSYRADTSRLPIEESSGDESRDPSIVDVTFIAEQVSHHPPISAFYAECPGKRLQMNGDVWTKSRFLGMGIGVHLEGQVCISVLEHEEDYWFTLPSAFARSILTVPWVELGGRINIVCEKSEYQASVTFHTKPLYGGKRHRISGDIRHQSSSSPICKISGEWNDKIELTFDGKEPVVLDATVPATRKTVRPISEQGEFESRRLWRHVTIALKTGDLQKATDEKKALEERQRSEVKERESKGIDYRPKLFHHDINQRWLYNDPLSGR